MIIIQLRTRAEWYRANWVFRQFAEDLLCRYPDDVDLKMVLERTEAFGSLRFDSLGTEAATRLETAMLEVANATLAGTIKGWKGRRPDDKQGHDHYLEAMKDLAEMLCSHQEE